MVEGRWIVSVHAERLNLDFNHCSVRGDHAALLGHPEGLLRGPLRIGDHGPGELPRGQLSIGSISPVGKGFEDDTDPRFIGDFPRKAGMSPAQCHPEKRPIDGCDGFGHGPGQRFVSHTHVV